MSKPSIPKGTRDFGPIQAKQRMYIFNTIRSVFVKYGYNPIETPAYELLETLTGKYGEEGDRLIFKIFPRGEKLEKMLDNISEGNISKHIEEALRYDLTVPFARYVVQHQHEITFPFKRYQIQPVWRADRPQKGRYREFYQCDVDVIGSNSLWNEVELILILHEVFSVLKVPKVKIKLNNRKILAGISEYMGVPDKLMDITIGLDKLDKMGWEKVKEELLAKQIPLTSMFKLEEIMSLYKESDSIQKIQNTLNYIPIAQKGFEELKWVMEKSNHLSVSNVHFDITLARGLNYYTGAIFEVTSDDFPSSISGGGRYDDLTGIFGLKNVSGVGVSFGADRIYDILLERNLFPQHEIDHTQVLFVNFGDVEAEYCMPMIQFLRSKNISTELFPDSLGMKKQFKYANDKNIPFVIIVGNDEMQSATVKIKNMISGEETVKNSKEQLIEYLQLT